MSLKTDVGGLNLSQGVPFSLLQCRKGRTRMCLERQLIDLKANSAEEIATVWLTTADMGFSLTAEPNEITCVVLVYCFMMVPSILFQCVRPYPRPRLARSPRPPLIF